MSEWRDIWKEALVSGKNMIINRDINANCFESLVKKHENDGMVFFEMAEAFEFLKKYEKAIENYEKAKRYFPVPHWQAVAEFSLERVKSYSPDYVRKSYDDFYKLQWDNFHEVHGFVNILDECRYLAVTALTRIDSETTIALVNFRTILEKEIKEHYPEIVKSFGDNFCLSKALNALEKEIQNVDWEIIQDMDNVRDGGNLAAHENKYNRKYLKRNVYSFINILGYFNSL